MIWKIMIPVLVSALIGWGAWATVQVTSSTPRVVFDKHVEKAEDRFNTMQNRIEDKLDKIQEHLINKGD
jgi:hypothetical protein